jgi:peptidoglycan-associated lipoprotein
MALMNRSTILVAWPIIGLAFACGGSQGPPAATASTPGATVTTTTTVTETPAQAKSSGGIRISADILKACGLADADAYFPFDSARLEKQDIVPLNAVAICFTTGALKGRAMKLVGHADPRGATDYNMTLGQARADGVESYLERRGFDKAKVATSSRGAMDATGTDEGGWVRDRRVDLLLAN